MLPSHSIFDYPKVTKEQRAIIAEAKKQLEAEKAEIRAYRATDSVTHQAAPQPTRAIAQAIRRNTHSVKHGEIEVIERLRFDLEMPARLDGATSLASHDDRQVVMIVTVAVADSAAVDDHRTVEQRARAFWNRLEFAEQIGKLLDMESIDDLELLVLLGIASVVREVMVTRR